MKTTLEKILFASIIFSTVVPFVLFSAEKKLAFTKSYKPTPLAIGQVWSTTPLINAVNRNDAEEVRQLIESNVEVDVQDDRGETALIRSCKNNHPIQMEIMETLVKANADINLQNKDDLSALAYLTYGPLFGPCEQRMVRAKKLLETASTNEMGHIDSIDNKDTFGVTVLLGTIGKYCYSASEQQESELECIIKLLLHKNAQINVQDNNKDTPIQRIMLNNRLNIVNIFLDSGSFIDCDMRKDGYTVLTRFLINYNHLRQNDSQKQSGESSKIFDKLRERALRNSIFGILGIEIPKTIGYLLISFLPEQDVTSNNGPEVLASSIYGSKD